MEGILDSKGQKKKGALEYAPVSLGSRENHLEWSDIMYSHLSTVITVCQSTVVVRREAAARAWKWRRKLGRAEGRSRRRVCWQRLSSSSHLGTFFEFFVVFYNFFSTTRRSVCFPVANTVMFWFRFFSVSSLPFRPLSFCVTRGFHVSYTARFRCADPGYTRFYSVIHGRSGLLTAVVLGFGAHTYIITLSSCVYRMSYTKVYPFANVSCAEK